MTIGPLLALFAIVVFMAIKATIIDARNDERNNR